jgi:ParB family chromosome partitioning protein
MNQVVAAAVKFETIPIALIAPSADNPRKAFDHEAMHDLTASIRAEGVIEPVIVRKKNGGEVGYEIIAGERRWRAAKSAGLAAMPAIVREADDAEAKALRLVENIQRADLSLPEECAAVEQLLAVFSLEEVCTKLGKSKPWVSKRGAAKDLPAPIKKLVTSGEVSDIEVVSSLGELHAIDPQRATQVIGWGDLDRDQVRNQVRFAKEEKKREEQEQKVAAKAERTQPDKPSSAEKKHRELERKRNRLGAERKEFRDKAQPALLEALEIKPAKDSWRDPVALDYGESLSALTKLPATVDGCDFKLTADADITLLKRLASGLSEKPLVHCVVPDLTLDQAQRLSDALKDVKDLELGYAVTITGGQVLKLLSKLAPGRDLMTPANEQIAMFLGEHSVKQKDGQAKAGDVFKKYRAWCKAKKLDPVDQVAFGTAVAAAGVEKKRLKTGWHYAGIVLKA